MSSATIPLSKKLDASKLNFPVFLSQKVDGVPIRITIRPNPERYNFGNTIIVEAQTRQGKPVPSVEEDMKLLKDYLLRHVYYDHLPNITELVAEVTHESLTDFKDISGVVRKQEPQQGLIYNFFDWAVRGNWDAEFKERLMCLRASFSVKSDKFRVLDQVTVFDIDDLNYHIGIMLDEAPEWEGLIARSHDAGFKPGTRHWDYQKIVPTPTVDLRIVGVEEAISKDKEPKGMVGRLWAEYKGQRIGVGPGKMTHKERTELWQGFHSARPTREYPNRLACIQYKRDPSYEALREPTFQHWRDDKDEESYD